MQFLTTPGDVIQAVNTARGLEANPLKLVGRFVGFGAAEQKAGVPTWAWVVVAFGAGAGAMWVLGRRIRGPRAVQ